MMLLTQEQEMIRDAIRTFVREAIVPHAAAWDRDATFPKDVHRQLGELGAYGVAVPEALGGAGLDYLSLALILEEIAAGDGGTSTVISVNNCPVCSMLMAFANDAQKQQWLVPLARGEMLGAFCLTEPHVGSDASALRTTAVREKSGDGDHWVLNGVKQFITSGKHADVAIVLAVTDKTAGKRGISAFLVPAGTPPHKAQPLASGDDRLAMCRLAVAGHPRLRVGDWEVRRPGPSYTVETLRQFHADRPGDEPFLILGWDAAREMKGWREPEQVLQLARLVVVARPGLANPDRPALMEAGLDPARVILCLMGTPDVAATEIRRLSAHSRAIDSLVPAEVESYIRERGLYGGMAPEGIIG